MADTASSPLGSIFSVGKGRGSLWMRFGASPHTVRVDSISSLHKPLKLQKQRFDVILVYVRIANDVDELARLQAAHLREQSREQRV